MEDDDGGLVTYDKVLPSPIVPPLPLQPSYKKRPMSLQRRCKEGVSNRMSFASTGGPTLDYVNTDVVLPRMSSRNSCLGRSGHTSRQTARSHKTVEEEVEEGEPETSPEKHGSVLVRSPRIAFSLSHRNRTQLPPLAIHNSEQPESLSRGRSKSICVPMITGTPRMSKALDSARGPITARRRKSLAPGVLENGSNMALATAFPPPLVTSRGVSTPHDNNKLGFSTAKRRMENLVSFAPSLLLQVIEKNFKCSEDLVPMVKDFKAVVLFADISGFTALTETLTRDCDDGAEAVSHALNDFFGKLIIIIQRHGGDVVKFAGDAMLAIWKTEDTEGLASKEQLGELTYIAARCSLAIQEELKDYRTVMDKTLGLKISVGAGSMCYMIVGGTRGRWEFVVGGSTLAQISSAERQAQKGTIVFSDSALYFLGGKKNCIGHFLDSTTRFYVLQGLRGPRKPLPNVCPDQDRKVEPNVLQAFIPGAAQFRMDVVTESTAWLGEQRKLTILFINLPGCAHPSLDTVQSVMGIVQGICYTFEGALNKLVMDDKGTSIMVAMGLPPLSHQDDPFRGVQVALRIQSELRAINVKSAIGVTTGRVFCGSYGSSDCEEGFQRREYTMIGTPVNLSARLMQASRGGDDVLCDDATFTVCRDKIDFESLPPRTLKGIEGLVCIYRPLKLREIITRPMGQEKQTSRDTSEVLVGREEEKALFLRTLDAAKETGKSHMIGIQGEAGMGKTRLLQELCLEARDREVDVFVGSGNSVESNLPFHPFRDVFFTLLRFDEAIDNEQRQKCLLSVLEAKEYGKWVSYAPLFNTLINLGIPDNASVQSMSRDLQNQKLIDLLVYLIRVTTNGSLTMLALDDAQWFDSVSWTLIVEICKRLPHVVVVITSRGNAVSSAPELSKVTTMTTAKISGLSNGEVVTLVKNHLRVSEVSADLADVLVQRSNGNPLFIDALTATMHDAGVVIVEGGRCFLNPSQDVAISFPDSIESVILARIDRLQPSQQLLLKVASVVGRYFQTDILMFIYPIAVSMEAIKEDLKALSAADIIHKVTRDLSTKRLPSARGADDSTRLKGRAAFTPRFLFPPDSRGNSFATINGDDGEEAIFFFNHIVVWEVVYNQLLSSQRHQLHTSVAEWYETNVEDPRPFYGVMAYHWTKSNNPKKAIDACLRAAREAVQSSAADEAIKLFSLAVSVDVQNNCMESSMRTTVFLELAQLFLRIGEVRQAQSYAEEALAEMGLSLPGKMLLSVCVARQRLSFATRRWRWSHRQREQHRRTLSDAAMAHRVLAHCFFMMGKKKRLEYSVLRCLNAAERAGPSPTLPSIYAMCIFMGISNPRSFFEEGMTLATTMGLGTPMAELRMFYGWWLFHMGELDGAGRLLTEAEATLGDSGDRHLYDQCIMFQIQLQYYLGRYTRVLSMCTRALEGCGIYSDAHWMHAIMVWKAAALSMVDEQREAQDILMDAAEEFAALADGGELADFRVAHILQNGTMAAVLCRMGDIEGALRAADELLQHIQFPIPDTAVPYMAIHGAMETYMTALRRKPSGQYGAPSILLRHLHLALRVLERHAKRSVSLMRIPLWKGIILALEGKLVEALRVWKVSFTLADSSGMPVERAMTLYAMGLYADSDSLASAMMEFNSHGVVHFGRRCRAVQDERRMGGLKGLGSPSAIIQAWTAAGPAQAGSSCSSVLSSNRDLSDCEDMQSPKSPHEDSLDSHRVSALLPPPA